MTTPAPPTATLAAWLEQQVAADEALARAATAGPWEQVGDSVFAPEPAHSRPSVANCGWGRRDMSLPDAAHIAAQDPAQTLRRVVAIRQVLALHEAAASQVVRAEEMGWPHDVTRAAMVAYHDVLRALASQYADRDGYRAEEWRP